MSIGVEPEVHTHVYRAIEAGNFVDALKDKVAFVTGAGRGIGRAIALALAQSGPPRPPLAHPIRALRRRQPHPNPTQTKRTRLRSRRDRRARHRCRLCTDRLRARPGRHRRGRTPGGNAWRPFASADFGDWWKVVELNARAPLFLMQLAVRSMRKRGEGAIIVISSDAALRNIAGALAYCTAKTALDRAVGCLQLELDGEGKSGIHIYAVHPGGVRTQLVKELSTVHKDMEDMFPGFTNNVRTFFEGFDNPPELCAQTCVHLAAGRARELRGRYIDAERDIEAVVEQSDIVRRENLYDLGVRALGVRGEGKRTVTGRSGTLHVLA